MNAIYDLDMLSIVKRRLKLGDVQPSQIDENR